MKRVFFTLAVALAFASCGNEEAEPAASCGHLDNIKDFQSAYVPARTIRVWTPSRYNPDELYDVLYMHDGQMLFDASTSWNHQEWRIDETLDSLIEAGVIRPCIVVGIDNTEKRIGEYCPDDVAEFLPEGEPVYEKAEPLGNNYLKFLVDEVKPYIDSTYSVYTDPAHTFVMGSSCGGLISSYALCKYPDVFGGAACLSTHCTFMSNPLTQKGKDDSAAAYIEYLKAHLPAANSKLLYFDRGDLTIDAGYREQQDKINTVILSLGWDGNHFQYRFYPGHAHCEDDWAARLHVPLEFLLSVSD